MLKKWHKLMYILVNKNVFASLKDPQKLKVKKKQ